MGELKASVKPFDISKPEVWDAWVKVRGNKGSSGVDGVSIEAFEGRPEEQSVQGLEPDVLGHVLPAGCQSGSSILTGQPGVGPCGAPERGRPVAP